MSVSTLDPSILSKATLFPIISPGAEIVVVVTMRVKIKSINKYLYIHDILMCKT